MTTSLTLSKWLYEHGVVLETEKSWTNAYRYDEGFDLIDITYSKIITHLGDKELLKYPAFSCEELLEMLPDSLFINDCFYHLIIVKNEDEIVVRYDATYNDTVTLSDSYTSKNPAEALGLMVRYLIEKQGYVYDKEKRWLGKYRLILYLLGMIFG